MLHNHNCAHVDVVFHQVRSSNCG